MGKEYQKEYYQKNIEKIKERSLKRHWEKRKEILAKKRVHYIANRTKILKRNLLWNLANKERMKEYHKKYNISRRKKDPNFNFRHRLRSRLNVVLKKYGHGKDFPSNKYGIEYAKIIEHLKPFPKEMSNYHVDHIKPLCSFNLNDPEQIRKAFAPENHQWLYKTENLKKGGGYDKSYNKMEFR